MSWMHCSKVILMYPELYEHRNRPSEILDPYFLDRLDAKRRRPNQSCIVHRMYIQTHTLPIMITCFCFLQMMREYKKVRYRIGWVQLVLHQVITTFMCTSNSNYQEKNERRKVTNQIDIHFQMTVKKNFASFNLQQIYEGRIFYSS